MDLSNMMTAAATRAIGLYRHPNNGSTTTENPDSSSEAITVQCGGRQGDQNLESSSSNSASFIRLPSELSSSSENLNDGETIGLNDNRKRLMMDQPLAFNLGAPLVIIEPKKVKMSSSTSSKSSSIFGVGAPGGGDANKGSGSSPSNPAIILSDKKMYTIPALEQLNKQVAETGSYLFPNMYVGHEDHGEIQFIGFRDLKPLQEDGSSAIDLSKNVNFKHGGIELHGNAGSLKQGVNLFTLRNITRELFGKQFGIENPNDQDLFNILVELTLRMNAALAQYSEERGTWLFLAYPRGAGGRTN